jgi:3',5'-cyclic AMP phosphodiesterase CpdA
VPRCWERRKPLLRCVEAFDYAPRNPSHDGANAPVAKRKAASPIRILHLSDIHFRAGNAWDWGSVLRHLARFVAQEVASGLAPDLVVLTGDLAFSGQADEYALARTWLEEVLWSVLTVGSAPLLPRDRLLLVPGNHDVDRGAIGSVARMVQEGLLDKQNQNEVAEVLGNADQRELVIRRHASFLSFYGDWLGQSQTLPWWRKPFDIKGQRIHIAGLDSAWMASGDGDRGRLIIGRWQINQTVDVREAEGPDWRLALLHHPWDYLAEFDLRESRQAVHLHCDLLLRGHLHEGEVALVRPADPKRACLELAAGCLYESSRYPNAFQWVELHAQPRMVRVLFRVWNRGEWQVDRNQPGCPEGVAEIALGAEEARKETGIAAGGKGSARRLVSQRRATDSQGHSALPRAKGVGAHAHDETPVSDSGALQQPTGTSPTGGPFQFDCFLSHNSKDKKAVRALAAVLRQRGLAVWLDEEQLRPGTSSQRGLESGILAARTVAVLVGADGLGPWELEEQEAAIIAPRSAIRTCPVDWPCNTEECIKGTE